MRKFNENEKVVLMVKVNGITTAHPESAFVIPEDKGGEPEWVECNGMVACFTRRAGESALDYGIRKREYFYGC